ncbi:MAG: hypothetical protein WC322_00030 [Candidatus Paceibacterota bacterium]|jgi:hypothetical protein
MPEKLTAALTIKLTDRQLLSLQRRAEQKGVVPSEYMRSLLLGDLQAAFREYEALGAIFEDGALSDKDFLE